MMNQPQIANWINACNAVGGRWLVKRLSNNDTQHTGGHQAGPYVPKDFAFRAFPGLHTPNIQNPRQPFRLLSGSHNHASNANIIWYNNRQRGGTRDETRITGVDGAASPLLDPANTGAVALFFIPAIRRNRHCQYWVCRNQQEEAIAQVLTRRQIRPGEPLFW